MTKSHLPPGGQQDPLGVPLNMLAAFLPTQDFQVRREGATLVVDHEGYTTKVTVKPPGLRPPWAPPIQSVVLVVTELPDCIAYRQLPASRATASLLNSLASLGSVHAAEDRLLLASRLSCTNCGFEEWMDRNTPLLAARIMDGHQSILSGFERLMLSQPPPGGRSNWLPEDLKAAEIEISHLTSCECDEQELTASVPLDAFSTGRPTEGEACATLHMSTIQDHVHHGPGLSVSLLMPHHIADKSRINDLCHLLNVRELDASYECPHFGAWMPTHRLDGVIFRTFLPNYLHSIPDIASLFAVWNLNRAVWASEQLTREGIRL